MNLLRLVEVGHRNTGFIYSGRFMPAGSQRGCDHAAEDVFVHSLTVGQSNHCLDHTMAGEWGAFLCYRYGCFFNPRKVGTTRRIFILEHRSLIDAQFIKFFLMLVPDGVIFVKWQLRVQMMDDMSILARQNDG